ncbi:MAG: GatB/YqeY domain-containing protein [Acidobacteria bacterium]|nr:GatB/YqeY domain-containing protein [Acidobacteriota bacterium]
MAFIDRISADLTTAMRARDALRLGTLRMAKAALMNREVERGRGLDDAESLQVIAALIKQRRDSIEQFRAGRREDLASKEEAELAVLEAYLPPPVDPAELDRLVTQAITETGATSPKDMGRVMKAAMAKVAGQTVDGKALSELVKRKLAGG